MKKIEIELTDEEFNLIKKISLKKEMSEDSVIKHSLKIMEVVENLSDNKLINLNQLVIDNYKNKNQKSKDS